VFTFANGTILTHSHHEDCAIHGLRIDTTFQVTGGTGAFAGATGGGHEFSQLPGQPRSSSTGRSPSSHRAMCPRSETARAVYVGEVTARRGRRWAPMMRTGLRGAIR
jgi:hypothetical protein